MRIMLTIMSIVFLILKRSSLINLKLNDKEYIEKISGELKENEEDFSKQAIEVLVIMTGAVLAGYYALAALYINRYIFVVGSGIEIFCVAIGHYNLIRLMNTGEHKRRRGLDVLHFVFDVVYLLVILVFVQYV